MYFAMNGSCPQISLRTSQLKSWHMLVTIGKKFVTNVYGLSREFASAIAPIRSALDVRTARVSERYDILCTMATPFYVKCYCLAPFSLLASTGSSFAKTPIHASRIYRLHYVSISSDRVNIISANSSSIIYSQTEQAQILGQPILTTQTLLKQIFE